MTNNQLDALHHACVWHKADMLNAGANIRFPGIVDLRSRQPGRFTSQVAGAIKSLTSLNWTFPPDYEER